MYSIEYYILTLNRLQYINNLDTVQIEATTASTCRSENDSDTEVVPRTVWRIGMNQLFDMSNRVAVVTGSTKGMGLAIARALGAAGAKIVISSRSEETAKATADQLHETEGITAEGIGCDITDIDSVRRFAIQTQEAF